MWWRLHHLTKFPDRSDGTAGQGYDGGLPTQQGSGQGGAGGGAGAQGTDPDGGVPSGNTAGGNFVSKIVLQDHL